MSDYWLKRALADEARAHQLAKQTTAELKKVYQRQYQRVYTQMERLYGQIDWGDTLTRTQLWQYSRWKTLEQELRSFATQTPRIGIDKITSCLDKVFAETIGADISRFSGAGGSVFRASGDALSLINTAWSGESFSSRIWKNTATLAERIRSGMEDMLVSGRSLGDIKYQLMQEFSVGYNNASLLVQTEAAYVMNGAAKQRYKSAGIGKVRWSIAPEDGRECEICKARANKVWHIGNTPPMPAHPRCRCVWVAVVELPGENIPCTGEGEEADGEVKLPEEQKAKQSPEGTVRAEAPKAEYRGEELNRKIPKKQGKVLKNTPKYGIINTNGSVGFQSATENARRRIADDGHEIIDKPTYNKLTKSFIKSGGLIIRGDEADKFLGTHAHAAYIAGGKAAFFRDDATVSDVLEEMYHALQDKRHDYGEKPDRIGMTKREIDAQKYLLSVAEKYKIPENETAETLENLRSYEKDLEAFYMEERMQ